MTPGQRIKQARLAAGLSQQALAVAIGQFGDRRIVSRTTVAQWETGSTRGIEAANLFKAAQVLNVAPEWLLFGTGHMQPRPVSLDGLLPVSCNDRVVPVLQNILVVGREDMELDNNVLSYVGIDQELAKVTGPHVFALEIKENSMLPDFRPGDIVVVDPDISPQPGEIVAAKLHTGGVITLRKYRPIDAEVFELVALNEDWPKIVVDRENPAQILGTLVEHRCRRRVYVHETAKKCEA